MRIPWRYYFVNSYQSCSSFGPSETGARNFKTDMQWGGDNASCLFVVIQDPANTFSLVFLVFSTRFQQCGVARSTELLTPSNVGKFRRLKDYAILSQSSTVQTSTSQGVCWILQLPVYLGFFLLTVSETQDPVHFVSLC